MGPLENGKKLKILIASDAYKKQTNGVTNMVVTLAEELRSRGHEVKVLALSDTHSSYREGDDYYISSFSSPVYPDARQSPVLRNRLLRELRRWNPDIIHIHTEFSASRMAKHLAHVNHTPYVMTSHTDYGKFIQPMLHSRRLIRKVIKLWSYFAYHNARVLTVPSEKGREITRGYRLNCPVVVIPNGIRLDAYTDQPAVQLYTAVGMNGPTRFKGGVPQRKLHAMCLETQNPPDLPNRPSLPQRFTRAGEKYETVTRYVFKTE